MFDGLKSVLGKAFTCVLQEREIDNEFCPSAHGVSREAQDEGLTKGWACMTF